MLIKHIIIALVSVGLLATSLLAIEVQPQKKNAISSLLHSAENATKDRRYDEAIKFYKQANAKASAKVSGCKVESTPFIAGTNYYYDMALVYRVWGKSQVPAIRRGNYRRALAVLALAVQCETTYEQAMRRMKFLQAFLNSDLGQGHASLRAFQEARAFSVGDSNISNEQLDGLIMRIKQVLRQRER